MKLLILGKLIAAEKKSFSCLPCGGDSNTTLDEKIKAAYVDFIRGKNNLDIPLSDQEFFAITKILISHIKKEGLTGELCKSLISEMNLYDLISYGLHKNFDHFNSLTLKKSLENMEFYHCFVVLLKENIKLDENHVFFNLSSTQYEHLNHFYLEYIRHRPNQKEIMTTIVMLISSMPPQTSLDALLALSVHPQFDSRAFTDQSAKKLALTLILGMDKDYPGRYINLILNCPHLARLETTLITKMTKPGNSEAIEAILEQSPVPVELAEVLMMNQIPCSSILYASKHPKALVAAIKMLQQWGVRSFKDNLLHRLDKAADPEAEAKNYVIAARREFAPLALIAGTPKQSIPNNDLRAETPSP